MPSRKIFITVFLSSFSSIAFEITLTRIFSISLSYHFAFMVISIAMLGIAASGTFLAIYPRFKNFSNTGIYGLLLGISISACHAISNQIPFDPVRLSWDRIQLFYISLYYVILSIPFFFCGLIIAVSFSLISKKSGVVYGSDLSGAGAGSIAILFLMYLLPLEKIIFILSSTALAGAFIAGDKRIRIASSILVLLNLLISAAWPDVTHPRISQYKGLQSALRYPGAEHIKAYYSPFSRIDTFKSPAVRFAPGLSLKYLEPLPEQTGISIDAGDINAITDTKNEEGLKFLEYLPSSLPYYILPPHPRGRNVLIMEPKGGLQVLMAEYFNAHRVVKTESNELLIKIIRDDFKEFSKNIYGSNAFSGLGRTWLKSSNEKFDIIDVPLMSASPSGIFGISEDYRFTVEAFKEYLNHLNSTGIISINFFILPPPRTELRFLTTIVRALEETGIKNTKDHIAAIRSWGTISILIKKTELTFDDIRRIKKFSDERRFDLVYYNGIKDDETNIYVKMPDNEYPAAFKNIINPELRKDFIDNYIFDITPTSDVKPFFNYFLRLKNIKPIYEVMGRKWQYFIEEGYLLPAIFIQVLILSVILILSPIPSQVKVKLKLGFLPYFGLLGMGFMFIEISLIQSMILPLGNPSYAIASVLTSILISSAAGSFLSQRFSKLRSPYAALLISLIIIMFSFMMPRIQDLISQYPAPINFGLVFFTLLPAGILMGIPFPLGLRVLGEKEPSLIPWAWAINGCLSVLAPIITILIAMETGFGNVLLLGGFIYITAFILLNRFIRKHRIHNLC